MQQMPQRKQIKTIYLWLIFLITLGLGVLLILWVSKSDEKTNTLALILMVIDFVVMTMSINSAIARTFRYKPRPKKCIVRKFQGPSSSELDKNLVRLGFNKKGVRFGHGYVKIEGETAYKVVVIEDCSKYFTSADNLSKETKEEKPTPGIDKCTKFIGFEIFYSTNEEVKTKILDFSFQGKNIYYDGFYFDLDQGLFVEPNYLAPKDTHKEEYQKLLEYVSLTEVIEGDSINEEK